MKMRQRKRRVGHDINRLFIAILNTEHSEIGWLATVMKKSAKLRRKQC